MPQSQKFCNCMIYTFYSKCKIKRYLNFYSNLAIELSKRLTIPRLATGNFSKALITTSSGWKKTGFGNQDITLEQRPTVLLMLLQMPRDVGEVVALLCASFFHRQWKAVYTDPIFQAVERSQHCWVYISAFPFSIVSTLTSFFFGYIRAMVYFKKDMYIFFSSVYLENSEGTWSINLKNK